jgi:hypothetical protein
MVRRRDFRDPGGRSALRATSKTNPSQIGLPPRIDRSDISATSVRIGRRDLDHEFTQKISTQNQSTF